MIIVIDNCSIYYTKTFNGKSCFKEAKINSLLVYYFRVLRVYFLMIPYLDLNLRIIIHEFSFSYCRVTSLLGVTRKNLCY